MLDMSAGHFIFIPAVLLFGLVLGWILGSRAAADAYAAEFKRREERAARAAERARCPPTIVASSGAANTTPYDRRAGHAVAGEGPLR